MSIKNPIAYCANLWDWGCLNGCFGDTQIRPTDIDGMVERNGRFLTIEAKSPGKPLDYGQMRTLRILAWSGYHTIIVVWGKPGNPVKMMWFSKDKELTEENANVEKFRQWVSCWFQQADALPPIPDDPKWYDENIPPPDMLEP